MSNFLFQTSSRKRSFGVALLEEASARVRKRTA